MTARARTESEGAPRSRSGDPLIEAGFRAMGTDVHVLVHQAPPERAGSPTTPRAADLVEQIRCRIEELEARWSRFRADSELSRLNHSGGRPMVVSPVTSLLLQRAVWAWQVTGGRFDPTVLHSLLGAGYDRDFDAITAPATATGAAHREHLMNRPTPAPGCDGILVDPATNLVMTPPGVGVDPGGIGKGMAADLAATEAVSAGATAALVSLGGDLRVSGTAPPEGWEIELDHHVSAGARVNLRAGAVATSSVLRRRWRTPAGPAHHVIDPRSGAPSTGRAVAVSVVAGEAWWAEVLATAILVGHRDDVPTGWIDDLLGTAGALLTASDGTQGTFGDARHAFSLGASSSVDAFANGSSTAERSRRGRVA